MAEERCTLISIRRYLIIPAIILITGTLAIILPQPVHAQSVASCSEAIKSLDIDRDGQAEGMVLACQFSPSTHDELTIYKQSGKISLNIPWQEAITYENETWIFDHGTKGKASLIISFRRDGAALVAELYDDRNADGEVSYDINNGQVVITENKYWTVQVVAEEGWWIRDGIPNYNLHILVDGDVEAMFLMESYRSALLTDGKPDYDIRIYDTDHNGKPEFDKRMELTPWLQESVGLGTQMMANWVDDEPTLTGGFSLWPYLDLAHTWTSGSRIVKGYLSSFPPIMYEPATSRIEAVGEFVASRGGEHNCFFYSTIPWKTEEINQTDFESPFCFYDLAQDNDGIPELEVRANYWLPNDTAFRGGSFPEPYETIRYSWDQGNTQTWRFAVGLVGRHLEDERVSFPDGIVVGTIPYSEFSAWVTNRTWDMAVFSEFTGEQYWTSEGMYAVSYPENDTKFADYFTGGTEIIPSPDYSPDPDFRMEWGINYNQQPYLYFSPVDHRLHLLGASGGTWTLDENRSVLYKNLDGGDLINQWTYQVKGQPEKSLVVLNNLILLSENNAITIRLSNTPKSQFKTLPPGNHNEWVKLGANLEQNRATFAPDDFETMAAQFGKADDVIMGASWHDLRIIKNGFRFVLTLQKEFSVIGDDLLGINKQTPGEYAVTYNIGTFHMQSLTPAAIQASFAAPQPVDSPPTQYIEKDFQVLLRNTGLEDAQQVQVSLGMAQSGQAVQWSEPQTVAVLAGESTLVHFKWAPEAPGEWKLQAQASMLDDGNNSIVTAEQMVKVQAAQQTSRHQELSAFGVVAPWQVLLLLAGMGVTAGLAAWVLTRSLGREAEGPQQPGGSEKAGPQ